MSNPTETGVVSIMSTFLRACCSTALVFSTMAMTMAVETISLSPSSTSVPVGGTFTVTVNIAGAAPFANWAQQLDWDPAQLELKSQAAGTFSSFLSDSSGLSAINAIGSVHAGGFGVSDNAGGSGSLGVFTFQVLQSGSLQISAIGKSGSKPFGFELVQSDGGNPRVPTLPGPLTITGTVVLPTVTIAATDANAAETSGAANGGTFTLTRTGSTAATLTVNLSAGGSATSGSDYTAIQPTVTFPSGSSTATVSVDVINDAGVESLESVQLTLTAGTGYHVGSPSNATVSIADDDAPVSVTIVATDSAAAEVSAGAANGGLFTVTRTGSTAGGLTVNLSIGGTATNGTDVATIPGAVSIPAGSATTTIAVTVTDDALVEGNETVVVGVSNGGGYAVGSPASATVTVADNEPGSGGGGVKNKGGGAGGGCGAGAGAFAMLLGLLSCLVRRQR